MEDGWVELPYWEEWGQVTKIHGSALIAFRDSVAAHKDKGVSETLGTAVGHSGFKTSVKDHLSRLSGAEEIHKMALFSYYSIFEAFCRYFSYVQSSGANGKVFPALPDHLIEEIEAFVLPGGPEAWASRTLESAHQDWEKVYGGKSGIVEVSIVRNAIAHGVTRVNDVMVSKAQHRGVTLPFKVGEEISINFELLNEYRGRLRSYCRVISDGMVHLARGTHNSGSRMK